MTDEFWQRMQGVSQIMTDLEHEHKRFFSNKEELELLNYKQNFCESCIFWAEAEGVSDEEKETRIRWEYNNMFDKLTNLINNNVEEWEQDQERNRNEDYDIEIYDEDEYNKKDEF